MSYKEKRGSFLSADGHSNIVYRICIPEENPKGIIQIAHGMCEYFDRYEDTVRYFTDRGFVVCGNDHIGHGYSATAEELGHIGDDGWECMTRDLYATTVQVRNIFRSLPLILLGHSMGSFVVRDYLTKHAGNIDGAVICGTAGSNKALGAGLMLCSLIEKVKGSKYRSQLIKKIAFSGYNSHFKSEKDPNSWLTRESEVRRRYAEDKWCNYTFTVGAYKNLFTLLREVNSEEWATKVPMSMPVFIISGEEDPVGGYGAGANEVFDKLNQQELNLLKLKLYPDCRHELFNEHNRTEVWDDVLSFADEVIEGVLEARGYGRY